MQQYIWSSLLVGLLLVFGCSRSKDTRKPADAAAAGPMMAESPLAAHIGYWTLDQAAVEAMIADLEATEGGDQEALAIARFMLDQATSGNTQELRGDALVLYQEGNRQTLAIRDVTGTSEQFTLSTKQGDLVFAWNEPILSYTFGGEGMAIPLKRLEGPELAARKKLIAEAEAQGMSEPAAGAKSEAP